MTRPTSLSREIPTLTHRLGSVFPAPASLSSNVVDRAAGIDVVIPGGGGSITLVQEAEATTAVALGATATAGNLLVLSIARRDSTATIATPAGYTAHPDATVGNGVDGVAMFYKISDGTETGYTGSGNIVVGLSEWSGVTVLDDSAETNGASTDMTGASVTPTAGAAALIVGGFVVQTGDFGTSATPTAPWTELHDAMVTGPFHPLLWSAYQIAASASGSYAPVGTPTNTLGTFGAQTLAFAVSGDPISGGPNATDGDDSTCIEGLSGTTVADIDLGDRYQIVRSTVRLATAAGGSRTYTISGYNVADGSDIETLDSVTFTADGSFIAQTINFSWNNGESYRYFRLTGPDETRNLCTWELYEPTVGDFHDHDYIPEDTFDALGDLLVGTGSDTYARKGSVASNVYVPTSEQNGDWNWGPFVRSIVSNGSNTIQRPDIAVQAGTGIALGVSSNTLTITSTVSSGGGGGSVDLSYGSNANDVGGASAAGASTLVSRADHVHKGVTAIAHASNTYAGTVTLTTPGNTVGITSPTPGTLAFTASGGSSGGGGSGSFDPDIHMPWLVNINAWMTSAQTNWSTIAATYFMQSNGTQNDSRSWPVDLAAGTWTFEGVFYRNTNHGIMHVQIDGSDVGTIDLYGAGLAHYEASLAGIVIAAPGPYTLTLKMASKNASSSAYYGLIRDAWFRRTA